MSHAAIPVIDIAPMLAGLPGASEAVATEIGKACRGIGFFYITGHGIAGGLGFEVSDVCWQCPDG